jgi:hypothetical protein
VEDRLIALLITRLALVAAFTSILAGCGLGSGGPITKAFDTATPDSIATDVSRQVSEVFPTGTHVADINRAFASEGFSCHRSQIADPRVLWTCQRQAFRLNLFRVWETWVVEVECRNDLAPCTIQNVYAEIRD